MNDLNLDRETTEELKKIVLARMTVMPENLSISVGSNELSKKDLIEHVKKGDALGNQMMEIQLDFLRDLASGAVYGDE